METFNINGKKYQISFVDTEDTVKNMIALREQTFTKYILFTVYKPSSKKIKIELLSNKINDIDEEKLLESIDDLHKKWNVSKTDIALEWLEQYRGGELQWQDYDIFKQINDTDFWSEDAIKTAYQGYLKRKASDLKKLVQIVEKESQFRLDYDKYQPLDTTKFLQDSVIIEYQINIDMDPLEAFDSVNLNSTIPFVRLKTVDQVYYKLTKTLVPQKDWLEGDSTLIFKIYRPGDKEGWGTATINYTGFADPFTAVMTIESTVGKGKKSSEDAIKNEIIGVFTGANIEIVDRKEKGVKGVFAVPEMNISRDVFLDLITNEPMVSHYLYVDETRELSSQKGVLYVYYSPGETESQVLTVFLSERTASRSDVFYTSKELLLFTPYLNVRVSRAMNLDQIERFKKAFAVILEVYKKKFASISKAYEKVIPGFKAANELTVKKTTRADKRLKALQSQDSELFIHGYPTSCERKRQPIPIKNAEQKKWEKTTQVMNYPKGSTNFFVCSSENAYKFPGLMKNKLDNADMYPYLPCCYPTNQKIGNKQWNLYLKDLTKATHSKTTNIVTKKAVGRGKLGHLPRNVHYILNKSAKEGEEYLRQGVAVSNNSFIETVLLALDVGYDKLTSDAEKTAYVQDFRNNLPAGEFASVIQELYDSNAEKITNEILDPEIVFDSKLFVGLLEAYYNCQIVVFVRSDQQPNGEFEIPRYTQGYLYKKLDPNVKTVLIYKHIGARSDSLENPHYELIVRKYKKLTVWHYENDVMIQNIYSYFLKTYQLYLIGIGRYMAITIPPDSLADAKGQVIDRYGKARGYIFKKNIFMVTSPITPADNIQIRDVPDERVALSDVQAFIKARGLKISKQDVSDGKAIGFVIDFPNIPYAYIPFKPTKKLSNIPKGEHLGFSVPTKEDILKKTLDNRKIADFLMQLLLYNFSLWYSDQSETTEFQESEQDISELPLANQKVREKAMLLNMVEEYLDTNLVIIPDHDYDVDNLPRRLTINNSFFQDEQLVVDSQETFNRLGYYLRFMITKNKMLVIRYSDRSFLDNYYTYADDFQIREGQLIFVGGLSISNWIETQQHGISNQVHYIPHAYLNEPFFYSHWALNGGKPVIFQNVKYGSLGRALAVAVKYSNDDINVGYDPKPITKVDYTEYFIEDGILKRKGDGPIKLWRFQDDFYAALLIPKIL